LERCKTTENNNCSSISGSEEGGRYMTAVDGPNRQQEMREGEEENEEGE